MLVDRARPLSLASNRLCISIIYHLVFFLFDHDKYITFVKNLNILNFKELLKLAPKGSMNAMNKGIKKIQADKSFHDPISC